MGSGQFKPDDIIFLTRKAIDAFEDCFGTAPVPQAVIPAQIGSAQHISIQADKVVAAVEDSSFPPSAGFDSWKDQRCRYGKAEWLLNEKPWPEATWAEVLRAANSGNSAAFNALRTMSKTPDPQSKWYSQDKIKSERANKVLAMVKR